MIPNLKERELETQGVTAATVFGISVNDSAHIMTILRDTLYTDKVMAVLREYSANAWDAHRESGKGDVPIKVTIPTDLDPTLRIQDFGPGLSHQEVFEVYTQYGASTKRNSDNSVGMLGIGSKSGFAYSDSFTVISCNGGVRRTYVAVLDASEKGIINLLDEQECGDETGVTIEIGIRKEDIPEFINKARDLYKYFSPLPIINIDLPNVTGSQIDMKNGRIDEDSQADYWVAIMGCVPYRINTDQLYENGERMVGAYVDEIKGALYFNIGEVQVNASREELKYSDSTKKALSEKFTALMDEYVESTIRKLEDGSFSSWQKRIRARMMAQLGLPLPQDLADLCKEWVELPEHKTFNLFREQGASPLSRLIIESDTRIFVRDDPTKSIRGYSFREHDFHIRPVDGASLEEVQKELTAVLEKGNLSGIPVQNMSTLYWAKPWDEQREEDKKRKKEESKALRALARAGQKANKKYYSRVFALKPDAKFSHPYSQMWEVVDEYEPEKSDVFVILDSFRVLDNTERDEKQQQRMFTNNVLEDTKLCGMLGIPMPRIYGYKRTDKIPIKVEDVTGVLYDTWRATFFKNMVDTAPMKRLLEIFDTVSAYPTRYHRSCRYNPKETAKEARKAYDILSAGLGPRHPISKWVGQASKALDLYKNMNDWERGILDELPPRVRKKSFQSPQQKTLKMFEKLYPVLPLGNDGLADLWNEGKSKTYLEYVKNMDQFRRLQNKRR